MRAPHLRNSKMSISTIICQKLSSRPLRKLWNLIVGCHDRNCSVHWSKFSAVDARFPKRKKLLYALAQFRPPPTSIFEKKSQPCLFPHNFEHCIHSLPISRTTRFAAHFKKFLRTLLFGVVKNQKL